MKTTESSAEMVLEVKFRYSASMRLFVRSESPKRESVLCHDGATEKVELILSLEAKYQDAVADQLRLLCMKSSHIAIGRSMPADSTNANSVCPNFRSSRSPCVRFPAIST